MRRREFLGSGAVLLAALGVGLAGCSSSTPGSASNQSTEGTTPPGSTGPTTPAGPTDSTTPSASGSSSSAGPSSPVVTGTAGAEVRANRPRMSPAPASSVRGSFGAFSLDLYRACVKPGAPTNFVFSPYSIVSALGMTAFGAKAATAAAFAKLLGGSAEQVAARLTAVDASIASAVSAGQNASGGAGKLDPTVVDNANSLFLQRNFTVQQAFLNALASGYDVGVRLEDFTDHPDTGRSDINGWVAQRTHDLIPALLPPGVITGQTRLVLVNALYLKAAWQSSFSVSGQAAFTTGSGVVKKPTFISASGSMSFGQGENWQSVTLPYGGGKLAMTILVPAAGSFESVAKSLTASDLSRAMSGRMRTVQLTMPKFVIDDNRDLVAVLQSMGYSALFDGADLSGIAGQPGDLEIGAVIHQAKISVDEHGTEAAAATAVAIAAMGAAPMDPVSLQVDRPFFFVVADTQTQMPLFLGTVADPTSG